mgnify:CR=1 FL=1
MDQDKDYWRNEVVGFLALTTLKGVGYWTLYKLLKRQIGLKNFLKSTQKEDFEGALHITLDLDGQEWIEYQRLLWDKGVALARQLSSLGIRLIFKRHPDFPSSLEEISDGPEWIFVQGELENLHSSSIAVVGTRKATNDGEFLTRYLIALLAHSKKVIVSGLAVGIDQIAHSEAIRYSLPTVAVLGTGVLKDYPKGSELLRKNILDSGGTIVSEYLPNQSYSAENFVRRNRIQAALSNVVVPVEWNIKSGTAHTVDFAFRYRKFIANLYLPGTSSARPELSFSQNRYGAESFEVPAQSDSLLDFLIHSGSEAVQPVQASFDL